VVTTPFKYVAFSSDSTAAVAVAADAFLRRPLAAHDVERRAEHEANNEQFIFTTTQFLATRRYASVVLAVTVSICLSICPSQVGLLLRRLNLESWKQNHTMAKGLQFADTKDLAEIPSGSPQRWRQIEVGTLKLAIFDPYLATCQKQCKIAT